MNISKLILFCLSVVITVVSCDKSDNLHMINSQNEIIKKDLQSCIDREIVKFKNDQSYYTERGVAFPANSWDYVGSKHNAAIDFMVGYNNPSSSNQVLQAFDALLIAEGFIPPIQINPDDYSHSKLENLYSSISQISNPDGTLNFLKISALPIDPIDRAIIETYYLNTTSISNINLRRAICKVTENFIRSSRDLSDDAKDRLLITFAVIRHSDEYWTSRGKRIGPASDAIDALTSYTVMYDLYYANNGGPHIVAAADLSAFIGAAMSIFHDILTGV